MAVHLEPLSLFAMPDGYRFNISLRLGDGECHRAEGPYYHAISECLYPPHPIKSGFLLSVLSSTVTQPSSINRALGPPKLDLLSHGTIPERHFQVPNVVGKICILSPAINGLPYISETQSGLERDLLVFLPSLSGLRDGSPSCETDSSARRVNRPPTLSVTDSQSPRLYPSLTRRQYGRLATHRLTGEDD